MNEPRLSELAGRVLIALHERKEMSRTAVSRLLQGHVERTDIDSILRVLNQRGYINWYSVPTQGRPKQIIFLAKDPTMETTADTARRLSRESGLRVSNVRNRLRKGESEQQILEWGRIRAEQDRELDRQLAFELQPHLDRFEKECIYNFLIWIKREGLSFNVEDADDEELNSVVDVYIRLKKQAKE